jgi:hypothetical protein
VRAPIVRILQEWRERPPDRLVVGHHELPGGRAVDGPRWQSIDEAIEWGRARAPLVLLHAEGDAPPLDGPPYGWQLYSVGARAARRDGSALPAWPHAKDAAAETADLEGIVWLFQEEPWYEPLQTFTARLEPEYVPLPPVLSRWLRHFDLPAAPEILEGVSLAEALAWARGRSPVVAVALGIPSCYTWYSAGSVPPPDDLPPLPSWYDPRYRAT